MTSRSVRRHRRIETSLSARVLLPDDQERVGVIVNASATGFAVWSGINATPGQRIAVEVQGMGRAEGRVVRLMKGGFAMKFDTQPSLSGDIRKFIERLANSF
jgi:hypothetical protein